MKKFGDYGIAPIRCETRVGGADVKEWLYKVNQILYLHKEDYVCPGLLHRMRKELRAVLIDLYGTEVPPVAQQKKDEILRKGKAYFQKMTDLERSFQWEPTDTEDIQRVLRFWVSKFVREKSSLTLEKAVELLKKMKQVYEDYYMDASKHLILDDVSTASFKSVQDELGVYINASLGI